jgi:hypothetical protein
MRVTRVAFLVTVALAFLATPLAGEAQQAAMPVIAFVNGLTAAEWAGPLAAFHNGLGETGLIATLSRPVGNVTGVYFLTGELEGKRLGLLRELVPTRALIAVLFNPKHLNTATVSKELRVAAQDLGSRPVSCTPAASVRLTTPVRPFPGCALQRCWSAPIHSSSPSASTSWRWQHATLSQRSTISASSPWPAA